MLSFILVLIAAGIFNYQLYRNKHAVDQAQVSLPETLRGRPSHLGTLEDRIIMLDSTQRLRVGMPGNMPVVASFEMAIEDMLVDETTGRIYVGDNLGALMILSGKGESILEIKMPGRISGLAEGPDGHLAVLWGKTGFGPDYFVSLLDVNNGGREVFQTPTGFATNLMVSGGDAIYYGTVNSRIGRINQSGQQDWRVIVDHPPRTMAYSPSGHVFLGDQKGRVLSLDERGKTQWIRKASRYPIRDILTLDDALLALDTQGSAFIYSYEGSTIYTRSHRQSTHTWVAWLHQGADVYAVQTDGGLVRLDFIGQPALRAWAVLNHLSFFLNPLFAVLGFVFLVYWIEPLRRRAAIFRLGLRRGWLAYVLLAPTFLLLMIFCFYPALSALYYSFTSFNLTTPRNFIGLDNYRAMMDDPYLWVGVRNMLIFILTGMLKTLVFPLLAAELVFWIAGDRLKHFMRTSFVLPTVVPMVVMILLWKMIYDPQIGLINQVLGLFGLGSMERAWLADENFAIWAIVFSGFPWVEAFPFLIYLGGLININKDLFEAAQIDGCSVWGRLRSIELPLLLPQIKLLVTFVFIGSIQDFTRVLVFTRGGPGISTYVPALQMFFQTAEGGDLGYASAIGVVLFVIVFTFTVLNLRLVRTHHD